MAIEPGEGRSAVDGALALVGVLLIGQAWSSAQQFLNVRDALAAGGGRVGWGGLAGPALLAATGFATGVLAVVVGKRRWAVASAIAGAVVAGCVVAW